MTAGITPVSAPHGKGFYVAGAVFASLFGFALLWGTFATTSFAGRPLDTPVVWRLLGAGCAAIYLLGALQAFERWLSPATAQARSAAISSVARRRLRLLRKVLAMAGIIGLAVALIVGRSGTRPDADFEILSWALLFAGFLVADLCGERG